MAATCAVLGLGGAKLFYPAINFHCARFLPGFQVANSTLIVGAAVALGPMLPGGPGPAVRAARLYALRGRVRAWLLAPPLIESAAWLPLGCVVIVDLVRRPNACSLGLLAGATAASWLAGGGLSPNAGSRGTCT
mgnify:CR=1 FL=1